jgi:hypothetical protein
VDSRRVSRAPRYSGTGFESRSFSSTRLSRSMARLSRRVRLTTELVTLLLPALQPLLHPIRIQLIFDRATKVTILFGRFAVLTLQTGSSELASSVS